MPRLAAIAIAGTILAGCGDEDPQTMRAFCQAYKSSMDASAGAPRTKPEFGSQTTPPGFADYERASELASASGNERIERTYAELKRRTDVGIDPPDSAVDQYGDAFIDAYQATVEECQKAGYPVL